MDKLDLKERWDNYRKANSDKPLVRYSELLEIFNLLNPQEGENILEVGTGNGYLTFPIAKAVGSTGSILTADVSEDNIKSIQDSEEDKSNIDTLLFNDKDLFLKNKDESFDAVATIATLHHFDNKNDNTGEENKITALKEFYRLLKRDGRLVIADVAQDTISQKYFDAIDNPRYCFPEGHPYEFFTTTRLEEVLREIGFNDINISVKRVPWKFTSIEEVKTFINTSHNSKCSEEESLKVAEEYLGLNKTNSGYELGWELFFASAKK